MTERVFTNEDQLAFARLSGDENPLHLDPTSARRLMFGKQVAHGVHALLWALDGYFEVKTPSLRLLTVKAAFQAGIGVGATVKCSYTPADESGLEIRLQVNGAPAAWIKVGWGNRDQPITTTLPTAIPENLDCRDRPLEELKTASGALPLYLDLPLSQRLFPNLSRMLPPMQLAELLAATRLVGMECPGLHSIFSGLELTYSSQARGGPQMAYQVVTCNPKISLLLMKISAPGMDGKVKAFIRPKSQRQATFAEVSRRADPEEFASQRAIVIGGSRGLGEVTAKLLAAGGAEVIISYYKGEEDARRVVEEIVSAGARASFFQLNVLAPPADLLSKLSWGSRPMVLYYFATPFIFGNTKGKFSPARFNKFCDYYVTGFFRTVQLLKPGPGGLEKIFYPSTTAIEEMPVDMGEYAAAKTAGELLCTFLEKTLPGISIDRPRLPRLATDQTVSLLPVDNQKPISLLLSHLRKLRDS